MSGDHEYDAEKSLRPLFRVCARFFFHVHVVPIEKLWYDLLSQTTKKIRTFLWSRIVSKKRSVGAEKLNLTIPFLETEVVGPRGTRIDLTRLLKGCVGSALTNYYSMKTIVDCFNITLLVKLHWRSFLKLKRGNWVISSLGFLVLNRSSIVTKYVAINNQNVLKLKFVFLFLEVQPINCVWRLFYVQRN